MIFRFVSELNCHVPWEFGVFKSENTLISGVFISEKLPLIGELSKLFLLLNLRISFDIDFKTSSSIPTNRLLVILLPTRERPLSPAKAGFADPCA